MKYTEFKEYHEKAFTGEIEDEQNPAFILSGVSVQLLSRVAKGEFDLKELAKRELENQGMNINGKWAGMNHAIK